MHGNTPRHSGQGAQEGTGTGTGIGTGTGTGTGTKKVASCQCLLC